MNRDRWRARSPARGRPQQPSASRSRRRERCVTTRRGLNSTSLTRTASQPSGRHVELEGRAGPVPEIRHPVDLPDASSRRQRTRPDRKQRPWRRRARRPSRSCRPSRTRRWQVGRPGRPRRPVAPADPVTLPAQPDRSPQQNQGPALPSHPSLPCTGLRWASDPEIQVAPVALVARRTLSRPHLSDPLVDERHDLVVQVRTTPPFCTSRATHTPSLTTERTTMSPISSR